MSMTGYRVCADHVITEHGAVLLDLAAGDLVFLNPASGRILERLAAGDDTSVIVERIVAATGVDPTRAEQDIRALIAEHADRRLLTATLGGTR
jgi:hypothetical protein